MTYWGNKVVTRRHVVAGTTAGDLVSVTTVPTALHAIHGLNRSTGTIAYLHIYDSTVALSSGSADATFVVPGAVSPTTVSIGSGIVYSAGGNPLILDNGLAFAIGGNFASSAAFSTIAADLAVVTLFYERQSGNTS